jgi:hypothetical protein
MNCQMHSLTIRVSQKIFILARNAPEREEVQNKTIQLPERSMVTKCYFVAKKQRNLVNVDRHQEDTP